MTNELRTYLTEQVNAFKKTHIPAVQKPKQFALNGWKQPVLIKKQK